MLDFVMVGITEKKDYTEVFPKFKIGKVSDLMVKGKAFYAIWNEKTKLWSTDLFEAVSLIDEFIDEAAVKLNISKNIRVLHLYDSSNGMIDNFHKYCQKQMGDNWHQLNEKIIFSNHDLKKTDYASYVLPYALEAGETSAYDKLMSTLYSKEERHKLEWAIGSVVNGDSRKIQKFIVLYGAAGTGKSTILDIIAMMFDGYCATFSSEELASNSGTFALEAFKNNPLVAYEHEGNLSRIETNSRLNALISHEKMYVNEKFKSRYEQKFNAFLFIGSNNPVKITDSKSGLIRRLIDVQPTGNLLPVDEYDDCMERVSFELGAIAYHCKEVYEKDKKYYNNYKPILMMGETNDFYNFILDYYDKFNTNEPITKKLAWAWYKEYVDEANFPYPYSQRAFKNELKNYFNDFKSVYTMDGVRCTDVYFGFKLTLENTEAQAVEPQKNYRINLNTRASLFDILFKDCIAQYSVHTKDGRDIPEQEWAKVTSKLSDLKTWRSHYVKTPENLIIIDFDLKDANGEKDLEQNLKAASKWPPTYTETSNSGKGIHLHYYYNGDVKELEKEYAQGIEIKVYTGGSALRRRVVLCNDLPIATINSGLPLKKKGEKMVNSNTIKTEHGLRAFVESCLEKRHHGATKPEVDFIKKVLDDAYESGMKYDISDMRNTVLTFAASSTNQSEYCIKLVPLIHFKSDEIADGVETPDYLESPLIFFDVEVFPNLFLINWKYEDSKECVRMINPKPHEVDKFLHMGRLVGFNCKGYDNHIVYAASIGWNNAELYDLSRRIVSENKEISKAAKFGVAYNLSYTDIYDYAVKRQSLKKWEIELGINHLELGLPWDQPVPEDKWIMVAEYCDNDVFSTQAVWNATQADFKTRKILAKLSGKTVNDSTNSLIESIVFGGNKNPQNEFNYRKMWEKPDGDYFTYEDAFDYAIGKTDILPKGKVWFKDYKFWMEKGEDNKMHAHSSYRDVDDVGEGGYVYSKQGIFYDIPTQDVSGEHPASLIQEKLLGPYTDTYEGIVDARLAIKNGDFDTARTMLDGRLAEFLDDESEADDMATALKLVVNRVYGQTFTAYPNPFKDPNNVDNIVAKRGSLFMIDLRNAVEKLGWTVVHCKTDSIKIPYANTELINFIRRFGKCYGYSFDTEAYYERLCLVNDAVYIARYHEPDICERDLGHIPKRNKKHPGEWTATGAEFQVPYIFKTLFTHEPIEFKDLCETKSVVGDAALYLDMNEDKNKFPDTSDIAREIKDLESLTKVLTLYEKDAYNTDKEVEKAFTKLKSFNKRYGTDFKIDGSLTDISNYLEELKAEEEKGHCYIFVGRVGQFTPVKKGGNGGVLVCKRHGKYVAVTGTKDTGNNDVYRWMESNMVRDRHEDLIDMSYYEKMAEKAKEHIWLYGDFNSFVESKTHEMPQFIDGEYMPYPKIPEVVPFN